MSEIINLSHPGQNDCNFANDILKCIFINENFYILIIIILKFVPKATIDIKSAKVIAWWQTGSKPLYKPMLTQFTDTYMQHQGEMS